MDKVRCGLEREVPRSSVRRLPCAPSASNGSGLPRSEEKKRFRMSHRLIEFHGANCAWCVNNMLTHLRSHELVTSAEFNAGTGCIEIDHGTVDFDELLAGVRADLRGWRQADNGERVMVDLEVHLSSACPFRPVEDA